jgi:hypothetical protein
MPETGNFQAKLESTRAKQFQKVHACVALNKIGKNVLIINLSWLWPCLLKSRVTIVSSWTSLRPQNTSQFTTNIFAHAVAFRTQRDRHLEQPEFAEAASSRLSEFPTSNRIDTAWSDFDVDEINQKDELTSPFT